MILTKLVVFVLVLLEIVLELLELAGNPRTRRPEPRYCVTCLQPQRHKLSADAETPYFVSQRANHAPDCISALILNRVDLAVHFLFDVVENILVCSRYFISTVFLAALIKS